MRAHLKKFFSVSVIAATLGFSLSSCQTPTPESRIAENPAIFATLTPEQQALVRQGKICEGMDTQAVFLAWGMPDNPPTVGQRNGKSTLRWVYFGYEPVTVFNSNPYPYWGPYGYYGAPATSTAFVPKEVAYVEFVDGKVTAWSRQGN